MRVKEEDVSGSYHSHPAKGRNALRDGTQMIEELGGAILLSELLNGLNALRNWRQ